MLRVLAPFRHELECRRAVAAATTARAAPSAAGEAEVLWGVVQIDRSHYGWVVGGVTPLSNEQGGRRNRSALWAAEEETTEAAMRTLWDWIECYGVPQAL